MRTWLNNKDVVLAFWTLGDDTKFRQSRLVDERRYAEDKRSKNVAAGRASALKRHEKASTVVKPKGNENPTNPYPNPNPIKEIDKSISFEQDKKLRSGWPENYKERFWQAYPRKIGKQKAMDALDIVRRKRKVEFAVLIVGVENLCRAREGADPNYTPHPATWLNRGGWDDDPDAISPKALMITLNQKPNRIDEDVFNKVRRKAETHERNAENRAENLLLIETGSKN